MSVLLLQVCHWQGVQQLHQAVRVYCVQCVGAWYHNAAISTSTWEHTRWHPEMIEPWTVQNLPRCRSFHWTTSRYASPLDVAWDPLPVISPVHHSQQKEALQRVAHQNLCLGFLPCLHLSIRLNPTTAVSDLMQNASVDTGWQAYDTHRKKSLILIKIEPVFNDVTQCLTHLWNKLLRLFLFQTASLSNGQYSKWIIF